MNATSSTNKNNNSKAVTRTEHGGRSEDRKMKSGLPNKRAGRASKLKQNEDQKKKHPSTRKRNVIQSVEGTMARLHRGMESSSSIYQQQQDENPVPPSPTKLPKEPVTTTASVGTTIAAPDLLAATSLGQESEPEAPQGWATSQTVSEPQPTTALTTAANESYRSVSASAIAGDDKTKYTSEPFAPALARPGFVWVQSHGPGDRPEWANRTTSTLSIRDVSGNDLLDDVDECECDDGGTVDSPDSTPLSPPKREKTSVLAVFGIKDSEETTVTTTPSPTAGASSIRPSVVSFFERQTSDEVRALPQAERISMKGRSSSFFFSGWGGHNDNNDDHDDYGIVAEIQRWSQRISMYQNIDDCHENSSKITKDRKSQKSFFDLNFFPQEDIPPELKRWEKHILALLEEKTMNDYNHTSFHCASDAELPPPQLKSTGSSTLDAPVQVIATATPIRLSTTVFVHQQQQQHPPSLWEQLGGFVEDIFSVWL